jgi:hypothetical protein
MSGPTDFVDRDRILPALSHLGQRESLGTAPR